MRIPSAFTCGLQSLSLAILIGDVAVVGGTPLPPKPARQIVDATASIQAATVKGFTDAHGNSVFLGIPFAETTGGENRQVPDASA